MLFRSNLAMKQRGLPDSNQFLFDASSLFKSVTKSLGYKAPEEMAAKESFLLASRVGLSKSALARAIQSANAWALAENAPAAREAVAILQETEKSMSFLMNGVKNGAAGLQAARQARQQLTLLSYEGSIEYAVKYVPEAWSQKYSAAGAQAASLLFRQALYSYLVKEGDALIMESAKDGSKYAAQAKALVQAEMRKDHAELAKVSDAGFELALNENLKFEYSLRLQIEINNQARAQEREAKSASYTPPKKDWLARRQERIADQVANEKLTAFLSTRQGQGVTEAQIQNWKQAYYRDALAKQVGLHLESADKAKAQGREDYVRMLDLVEKNAEELTTSALDKDLDLKRYMEKLSPLEQEKLKTSLYANNYLNAYKEAATDLEMIPALDPGQPGRFQKIRQTEVVRNSKFLTRTLRTFESFGDDQAGLKTGVMASLARNVPLFQDMWNSHRRMFKTILPGLTISYLWSYHAWQVHIPFASFAMMMLTSAATISTPSTWLNRAFRMNGMKAMEGMMSKIAYALPYAWVTFLGMFPLMMYSPDFAVFLNDYIREPIMGVFGQVSAKTWLEIAAGLGVVAVGAKLAGKTDFKEKAQNLKDVMLGKSRGGAIIRCEGVLAN